MSIVIYMLATTPTIVSPIPRLKIPAKGASRRSLYPEDIQNGSAHPSKSEKWLWKWKQRANQSLHQRYAFQTQTGKKTSSSHAWQWGDQSHDGLWMHSWIDVWVVPLAKFSIAKTKHMFMKNIRGKKYEKAIACEGSLLQLLNYEQ